MKHLTENGRAHAQPDKVTLFKIGEVAKLAGVGVETLRFYERSGLLESPVRTEGGYRLYDEQALNTLGFIKRAQALGFTLEEIRRVIADSRAGQKPCTEVRQIVRQRLQEIDQRLRTLQQFRDELANTLHHWEATGEADGLYCGLIENTQLDIPSPISTLKKRGRQ